MKEPHHLGRMHTNTTRDVLPPREVWPYTWSSSPSAPTFHWRDISYKHYLQRGGKTRTGQTSGSAFLFYFVLLCVNLQDVDSCSVYSAAVTFRALRLIGRDH